jgi:hypothetical protein
MGAPTGRRPPLRDTDRTPRPKRQTPSATGARGEGTYATQASAGRGWGDSYPACLCLQYSQHQAGAPVGQLATTCRDLHPASRERRFGAVAAHRIRAADKSFSALPAPLQGWLVAALFDRNSKTALSPEVLAARNAEVGMVLTPITIDRKTMDSNLIPSATVNAVLFKYWSDIVAIIAHGDLTISRRYVNLAQCLRNVPHCPNPRNPPASSLAAQHFSL